MADKTISLDARGIKIGGAYRTLLCASLFPFRIPRAHWAQRIQALKRSGYNCVDIYFPWNFYEQQDGSFDFTGERDVKEFLSLLSVAGIWAIVRPGPYICSEWSGGAIPARILESDMPLRVPDGQFMREAEKWYKAILPQIIPYEYGNGGTVILCQLDNELDFFDCPNPKGYIQALKEVALRCGVGVPLFVCAGQYGLELAGGQVEGVHKTLNCYPSWLDQTFENELRGYALRFKEADMPLFVSETHRDTFMLRRHLACGSKLLGAYNQVAGVNFGFMQAVNNWGSPVSFISTEYDFWSLIDVAGHYSDLFTQSRLLGGVIDCLGERLAKALPSPKPIEPVSCAFPHSEGGFSVLELYGGGKAVCVANYGDKEGKVTVRCNDRELSGIVSSHSAPFWIFDMPLKRYKIPATLTRANAELIRATENELIFCSDRQPTIAIDFGNGEKVINKNTVLKGIEIRFLTSERACDYLSSPERVRQYEYRERGAIPLYAGKNLPKPVKSEFSDKAYFTALGMVNGKAEYNVTVPAGKKLFIEHPCDLMSYAFDAKTYPTALADGRDCILPASKKGSYRVVVQKWGHSNFDDPGAPCLRLKCKKGVTSFGYVENEIKLERGNFKLLDEFGTKKIDLSDFYPVRLCNYQWNTTRSPAVCAYTFPVKRTCDRLIVNVSEKAEAAAYIDGALVGVCEFGKLELTKSLPDRREHKLTIVYRKRVYTESVGDIHLLEINEVGGTANILSEREFNSFTVKAGEEVSLPVTLKTGEVKTFAMDISGVDAEGIIEIRGKNVLLTCIADGRVVGRIIPEWEGGPPFAGGTQYKLYVSPTWNGEKISVYAEALCDGACITSLKYLS